MGEGGTSDAGAQVDARTDAGICGDGVVQSGETCDDGNAMGCGTCNASCNMTAGTGPCANGVGCNDDAVCSSALCAMGVCTACAGAGSCASSSAGPHCVDGVCGACNPRNNAGCSGSTPQCDPTSLTCVPPCGSNADCYPSKATCCVGVCVDTQSDPANCNACGQACVAGVPCSNGQCGAGL